MQELYDNECSVTCNQLSSECKNILSKVIKVTKMIALATLKISEITGECIVNSAVEVCQVVLDATNELKPQ